MVLLTASLFNKSGAGGPVGIRLMSAPWKPAVTPIKPTDQPLNRSADQTQETSVSLKQIVWLLIKLEPILP